MLINLEVSVAITKKDGTLIEQYAYSAFGEMRIFDGTGTEIQESQVGNIFGFTGREFDSESHLYYYRARYYDAKLGRFISADPIGFDGKDLNVYRYVKNRPLTYTDPSGNFGISDVIDAIKQYAYCQINPSKCAENDPDDADDVTFDDEDDDSRMLNNIIRSCPLIR